jgi:hypothetical protein
MCLDYLKFSSQLLTRDVDTAFDYSERKTNNS